VDIEEVAQDIYLLDLGRDPIYSVRQIAYWLVDDQTALIEPGSTATAVEFLVGARHAGLDLERLAYIIPTHIHVDHGGGSGYLAQKLPRARVVLHPRAVPHMTDPSRLVQALRQVHGDDFENAFGPVLPLNRDRILLADDGQVIHLGKRDLTVVFSPGHASHHISLMDSLTKGLFCGEALGFIADDMPDIISPAGAPPFDPDVYVETIDKLQGLGPELLFCSHLGVRRDVDALIASLRESCDAFGRIIEQGLQAGDDREQIWEQLSRYVNARHPGARLPLTFELTITGYIDYFKSQR